MLQLALLPLLHLVGLATVLALEMNEKDYDVLKFVINRPHPFRYTKFYYIAIPVTKPLPHKGPAYDS